MASLLSGTTIGGYTAIHTNNIGSYALTSVPSNVITTSGGQTIAGITYFSNGESLSLYGIRGRFTNEYIHLYNKVGIGHPSGWGQGEGNTPAYGLSTYGGMNIAYGTGASSTINGYLRINKDWAGGDYSAEQFTIRGTYPSIALRSTNSNSKWLIHNADRLQFYYGGTVDDNNWANKFEIATNGNIWMEWGGWLSDLLNAKQNASTAITTSNIGSQSVSYATSAGSATSASQVSGVAVSAAQAQALKNTLDSPTLPYKCDIYVEGEGDKFYPVHFMFGDQDIWRRIIIRRGYGEEAPWDPIGTGVHHGGLLLDWEGNFGGWGGAEYSDRLRVFNESYTNVCADMYLYTHSMGYVFMLRGGHALYHIFSDQPIRGYYQEGTPDIAYNSNTLFYDDNWSGNNTYDVYAPRPLGLSEVNSSRIDGLRTKKQSLFDSRYQLASSAINTSNIGSQSVNYASSAGSVAWTNVSSRPTALSQFTNDLGNYGGFLTSLGFSYSTGVSANHVVQRDGNGYIYANHINFNTPETENPAISSFITSNGDGWSRKSSLAHVRNQLGNYGNWITTDGRAYPRRSDGTNINFYWSGQGGQPTWLWGSNDGENFYVWNPSNFSVNYAATAGSADNIDGWGFRNTGSNDNVNADTIDSNGITYYTAGVSNFSGNSTDGALYSQRYSSSWQHQIAGDYRSGQIALRGRNNGTWTGWRTVLDSSNYSNWAIARSGDTIDNIIYFRTNQGEYLGSLDSAKLQVYNDNNQSAFMSFHRGGYYAVNFGLDRDNVMRIGGWSAAANRWELDMSGNNTVAGSFRAPIFYDSADTTYYGDFAGTSWLRHLSVGDVNASNDGGWNARLNLTGSSHARLDVKSNSDGIITTIYSHTGQGVGRVGTWSNHPLAFMVNGSIAGYAYANYLQGVDSVRAPIFYDSNDTGYYLDPNGSSNLNAVTANQYYANGWFRNYSTNGLYNESYGNHWYATSNATWNAAGNNGGYVEIAMRTGGHQGSIRGYFYADSSANIGILNNAGNWSLLTNSSRNTILYGQLTVGEGIGYSSIFMTDSDEGTREIHCNSNRIGFLTQAGAWGAYLDDSTNWFAVGSVQAPIFYDSNDTTYYLDPNADLSLKVYGEICNSNYQPGRLQPGALNIGRTDTNYAWEGGSWSEDVRVGILANTSETWEIAIHDSGDSVMSALHFDGGSTLTFGRNLGWGNCYVNAQAGYISNSNPWGTNNSAFFPNGITTAGGTNWIYGFTYIGNAPGNGNGHEFNANGTQYSTASITTPTFIVNSHSDNTRGYRIHNTSGTAVSAMFVNSSNQLVFAAGAVDQINLNKKVYVNGVALGVNVTPSATAGRIDASNDIVAYSSSDERLKHNITPIENALDKVKSLTGVEFDWKPEYKHAHGYEGHDTGIIAQQVQEVIPSAVRTNDTGFLAVRYEKLIGLLVEGMKEQQAQIDELKAKLDGIAR